MVYFITYSRIPDGDASATRCVAIAKIFMNCGIDVRLLGMGDSEYLKVYKYDGLSYLSLRMKGRDILTKLRNYFGFKGRVKKLLDNADDIEAIIVTGLPIDALGYIKKLSKKKGVKLFVDCCEWYSPEQFKMGRFSFPYIHNSYFVRRYIDKHTYPIAITKYLTSYFTQKGCRTINIPVVLDVENTKCNKNAGSDKLILMYAGSMGKKDYLDVMLQGLSLLTDEELAKVEFRIFGPILSEIKDNSEFALPDKVYGSIKCFGRVNREVVLRNLEDADFTVLMRSSTQRYAKAGFPTKVVESLAAATPVICNITSDLGDYIVDGYNGIVVNGDSADDFSLSIKEAIGFSAVEKEIMSKNARITAEKNFDYRLYKDCIVELVTDITD